MQKTVLGKNECGYALTSKIARSIECDVELSALAQEMSKRQIQYVFEQLEYPYSEFNIDREYSGKYWERWKVVVSKTRPEILLLCLKD